MSNGLEGIKVVEVGGAVAMPLVGMLMGSWGAEVIHIEPPKRGDLWRHTLASGMAGWAKPKRASTLSTPGRVLTAVGTANPSTFPAFACAA